ncbi:hypothetical protein H5410_058236 [Solanum commersonii]|uniref:Uncharacterized protein n=1 Tax=Solanum commersonii TaxID=4109 RepID=A0A9J5WT23_SOLCO|nr:hypothetical protein H5410_058236 [Solanum commersonii]
MVSLFPLGGSVPRRNGETSAGSHHEEGTKTKILLPQKFQMRESKRAIDFNYHPIHGGRKAFRALISFWAFLACIARLTNMPNIKGVIYKKYLRGVGLRRVKSLRMSTSKFIGCNFLNKKEERRSEGVVDGQ